MNDVLIPFSSRDLRFLGFKIVHLGGTFPDLWLVWEDPTVYKNLLIFKTQQDEITDLITLFNNQIANWTKVVHSYGLKLLKTELTENWIPNSSFYFTSVDCGELQCSKCMEAKAFSDSKILLPLLHIKLGLMKNFVKSL